MVARLTLVATFALGVLVWPLAAEAQQAQRIYRIGLLGVASPSGYAPQVEAFRGGLRDLGYVEGKSVVIEFRWAEGNSARLPELAAELVRLKPDVVVTSGPGITVAKRATGTIPIVMAAAGDAERSGLVESLARPGGNVTGSSFFFRELNAKRLEVLKEALPRLRRVGVLLHAESPTNTAVIRDMEDTARSIKVQLQVIAVRSAADFEDAFATIVKGRAGGLVVADHTMLVNEVARITDVARKNRLPTIGFVEVAKTGGLLAYGVNFPALWRRAAYFVDKILKGAKPADLPVEQPMRFEVVVNLKTAKVLGVTIPPAVLLRADHVIE